MNVIDTEQKELNYDDIQGIVLQERPTPYVGTYVLLSIDHLQDGKAMLQRLLDEVTSAGEWSKPHEGAWVNVGFTFRGLQKLGVPQDSLNSFDKEFREGMAARAAKLGDVNESSPEHWEDPLGTDKVDVALALFASTEEALHQAEEAAHRIHSDLRGISVIYRLEVGMNPDGRTHLGFMDGISNPRIQGNHIPNAVGQEDEIKAGEFLFGYVNESGTVTKGPEPVELGHNGCYLSLRKLHMRVAAFRRYLREHADHRDDEELLAAKMVGRWPSGAPLSLAPETDDPALGEDIHRRNAFTYADDPKGFKCPVSSHIRRAFPRDSLQDFVVNVNIHRLLRRSTMYGPVLPEGVMEDDGQDRGIIFAGICSSLSRQFEFIKTDWLNGGNFAGISTEKDPITGKNEGEGIFTIPDKPIRHRVKELPSFSITKGGEYFFIPSMTAIRWMVELD
ncbi:Dyp-type peroxidase [Paenibacillus polygoni]|uniref:Dyp-type peroxidase n=1 Tax=Paenibacillus polygoni TaxID=3050112 RepID=A0ABY8X555_9BACL|nr:Dyp-type peroxidase [Paenibacillus polygoni]WIV19814.1 Dyp-type peroxidase [Paenibacillus polygoni]